MITVIKCWFSRVLHTISELECCFGRVFCVVTVINYWLSMVLCDYCSKLLF